MALDQSLWFATFSADSIPAFTCPYCKKGTLSLHNKIVMEEPAYSKAAHSDEKLGAGLGRRAIYDDAQV
jgi:hypothetical protein